MRHTALVPLIAAIAATAAPIPTASDLLAQAITTATIQGTVRATDGTDAEGTEVVVVNTATGYVAQVDVRDGRFFVAGLEVGGPYTVTARRFGFHPEQRQQLSLELGESLELDFVMRPEAIPLDTLRVAVASPLAAAHPDGGTATTIRDSLLHRLPAPSREVYDFVRLVPQISTKTTFPTGSPFGSPGFSAGGVGFRFNNSLINGVSEQDMSGHTTRNLGIGGKSLPLGAVKEYQVLLAPYDVRYGDFVGALVNTVTRSGTNELTGSAFGYWRSERLSGEEDAPPDDVQLSFTVGGPILRDRLHFFGALERRHVTTPADGPYLGQPSSADPPVLVSAEDLARLDGILGAYGLAVGSAGPVANGNPETNVFGRLDLALPEWNSRAVLWGLYDRYSVEEFSRGPHNFPLSTLQLEHRATPVHLGFQLHTTPRGGGGHNELLVSYRTAWRDWVSDVDQPNIRVAFPETEQGPVTVVAGTPDRAQGRSGRQWSVHVVDNLTLPVGADHVMTLGATAERFRYDANTMLGSYGSWTFSSLDALEAGIAESFVIPQDFGNAAPSISGGQYGAYIGDRWRAGERVSITMGVRADLLSIEERPPYNPDVNRIFQRRTDEMPGPRIHVSPRLGFTWDVLGTGRDLLRGGVGVFTGRPPMQWYRAVLRRYGIGIGVLTCGEDGLGPPPPFEPDYRKAPTACANGAGLDSGPDGFDVNLLDRDLRMAQTLRGSLAYDRRLPGNMIATGEVLITRSISDFVFQNLNLAGPQGIDRNGRVLYGFIYPDGVSEPFPRSLFDEVVDLINTSRNHSYQLSASLERQFSNGMGAMVSYTHSHVRDVQTPLLTDPAVGGWLNWAGTPISGRHEDLTPSISVNDIPHRIIFAGTYEAPWKRWRTIVSLVYLGESGSPFTYGAYGGDDGRGDLNADGAANDPIYVPRDAFDPNEIAFSGFSFDPEDDNSEEVQAIRVREQQEAFERFINDIPCLRRQRGRILERNSCHDPWSHTMDLSVRQTIPIGGQAIEADLQVFNVLNLLNSSWGHVRGADPGLLEHVGQTEGDSPLPDEPTDPELIYRTETAQQIFRFFPDRPEWAPGPNESIYQIQLALHFGF
ncbi:MAG TPA: TonB-dependent receptor [Gemmatimonadota bacterium]|nr:TonB-dependent receptor [Gemmatimonadota bacterium]